MAAYTEWAPDVPATTSTSYVVLTSSTIWTQNYTTPFGPNNQTPNLTAYNFFDIKYTTFGTLGMTTPLGSISGQITKNTIGVPNTTVLLIHRTYLQVVNRTKTDASGNYIFTGLNESDISQGKYGIFALDNTESDYFNAGRLDRLSAG